MKLGWLRVIPTGEVVDGLGAKGHLMIMSGGGGGFDGLGPWCPLVHSIIDVDVIQ